MPKKLRPTINKNQVLESDDTFIIIDTKEATLINHNNIFDCKCTVCVRLSKIFGVE